MTHDPYVLLGVERTDSDAKIERALLRALERHDAPAKRAEARGAYRSIMAERGREPPAPGAAPDSLQGRKQSRDKGIVAAAPLAPPAGSDAAAPGRRGASAKDRRVAFGPDIHPDLSLAGVKRRMREIDAPLVKGRFEQCLADRKLGILYIIAQKPRARRRGMPPAKRFARLEFGIPYERLRLCAKLAERWPEFVPAHRWLTSKAARAAGWVAKEPTGARYADEAMGLRRDFLSGLGPTDREDAAEARRREKQAERAAQRAGGVETDGSRSNDPRRAVREKEAEVAALDEARRDAAQEAEWAKAGAKTWRRTAERRARWLARWVRAARGMKERAERAEARAERYRQRLIRLGQAADGGAEPAAAPVAER